MNNKRFRVEVVEIKSGKIVNVAGKDMSETRADKFEMFMISQIDTDNFFVRAVEEEIK